MHKETMIENRDFLNQNIFQKGKLGIPKTKGYENLYSLFQNYVSEYDEADSLYPIEYTYNNSGDEFSSAIENYLLNDIELLSENDSNKNENEITLFSEALFHNFVRETYLNPCENTAFSQEKYICHNIKVIKEIILNKTFLIHNQIQEIYLPPSKFKITICLDLDETLIHTDFEMKYNKHDFLYEGKIGVNFRPGLKTFLEFISKRFEVILFTSATEEYANKVLEILDPRNSIFSYKLYRQHCVSISSFATTKDLSVIKNRDINNIFLVDNNILNMANQIANGYLISSFYDDRSDKELFKLQKFLEESVSIGNSLKEKFKFCERLNYTNNLTN